MTVTNAVSLTLFATLTSLASAHLVSQKQGLDSAARRRVLQQVEDDLNSTYVFKELRQPLVKRLEDSWKAGRYNEADPNLLAAKITEDLRAVSHDGHLYLTSDPEAYAAAMAPPQSDTGMDAYLRRVAIRTHSGLTKQEILPGNLRYLKIEGFHWVPSLTPAAYDEAVNFLKDGEAIIIDLRENGGGESDAADYFLHSLLPLAKAKPTFLLVNGHVASAAEAVAYELKLEKVATIVGSTTYGAANNNKRLPVAPQFILSVSYNRPINPISGTNWEGVGVIPDLPVPATDALAAAQAEAYRRLLQGTGLSLDQVADYRWALEEVEAELHPVTISQAHLKALAGEYGTIRISYVNGALRLNRSDRPKWQKNLLLTPLRGDGTFQVQGLEDLRLRFTKAGLDLLHGSEAEREPFSRGKGN